MALKLNIDAIKDRVKDALKDNFKRDEKDCVNPWEADRSTVVLESRAFHETPVDPAKCSKLITKILYLLCKGGDISGPELTDMFFGITKLFQSTNTKLRRMVYLVLQSLRPSETEVFIVTSCLTKDMQSKNDCYRANAIRVLARILDPAMATQIDRYIKAAVVDKVPFVSSSALVCGFQLFSSVPDMVRRWTSEIQEAMLSKHPMVQFHAVALMSKIREADRLAHHKLIASLASNTGQRGPLTECLVIRLICSTLQAVDRDQSMERVLLHYLEGCLRNKSEAVAFEAARGFVNVAISESSSRPKGADSALPTILGHHDFTHAITVLQILLSSSKPTSRFGAVRLLSLLARSRPQLLSKCNSDLEPLLNDSNRAIGVLALATLLKTCHEANVERLVKQIQRFMSEITDGFRLEVVKAVRGLCEQYPGKFKPLMAFVSSALKEPSSLALKRELVESLILMVQKIPAAKEAGLLELCDFIEDYEFPTLCCDVLKFLGENIHDTPQPSKYVRFIFNRLILEGPEIRIAAAETLAQVALNCPALQSDISSLLESARDDQDDGVRDAITLFASIISDSHETVASELDLVLKPKLSFSIDALYDALEGHLDSEVVFDCSTLPSEAEYVKAKIAQAPVIIAEESVSQTKPVIVESANVVSALASVIPAETLGELQHSGRPVALTEAEAEYTVHLVKHIFKEHVVLEFQVSNTVEGVSLDNLIVKLGGVDPQLWFEVSALGIPSLAAHSSGVAYIILQRRNPVTVGNFQATLKFFLREGSRGYSDEYPVDAAVISISDYFYPRMLSPGNFNSTWDSLEASAAPESVQKYSLNFKTLEIATRAFLKNLNLDACERSEVVPADAAGRTHTLLLSGNFLGGETVLVRVLMGIDASRGCLVKVTAKSKNQEACDFVQRILE